MFLSKLHLTVFVKGPRRFQPYRAFSSSMGLCLNLACKYIQQNLSFHFLTRLEDMRVLKMAHFSPLKEQKQAETAEFMSLYLKEKLIRKES